MKEKQLKYILFPLVALVWGYAIYKYFIYEPDEEAAVAQTVDLNEEAGTPMKAVSTQLDSFQISEEYRDPFLGRVQGRRRPMGQAQGDQSARPVTTPVKGRPTQAKAQPKGVNWGRFGYYGTIKPTGEEQFYGLLSIDGLSYTVSEGQTIRGVKVGSIFEDSLHIVFEEDKHTVIK